MARAVTMWDFSWLLRRSGPQAEYADVDRVLNELADRGYDVVRIDAFPHWIAADNAEIVAEPQPAGFMWGNHSPVTVRPREALLEFLEGLRRRGIQAGLSTWFTPDTLNLADRIVTPQDLAEIWIHTLEIIRDAGLIDTVAYVDLCNEWPGWAPGIGRRLFGDIGTVFALPGPFSDEQLRAIDSYQESLRAVKEKIPGIPVTFSFFLRGARPPLSVDVMRLSTNDFDIAETHLWLSAGCPGFIDRTDWPDTFAVSEDVRTLTGHEKRVHERYPAERDSYLAELATLMDAWRDWAAGRDLPLWTTEGWASVLWSPDLVPGWSGWDYVKDVGAAAVDMAVERGWQGICTSNFSQPHHAGLWADLDWHRQQTTRIKS
jgi:hypothetical protein